LELAGGETRPLDVPGMFPALFRHVPGDFPEFRAVSPAISD